MSAAAAPEFAYLLRAQPWRETSLLIEILTATRGRIGALARGVRGARGQARRALLQPFQPLHISLAGRGELQQVVSVEAAAAALYLRGAAVLAGLYVNELLVRLLPRHEGQTDLFLAYARCLGALESESSIAWPLRRFEWQLLNVLGYAPDLNADTLGVALDPDRHYRLDAERGVVVATAASGAVAGRALIALARDGTADSEHLPALRRALRAVFSAQLGGRDLHSWGLLAELDALTG